MFQILLPVVCMGLILLLSNQSATPKTKHFPQSNPRIIEHFGTGGPDLSSRRTELANHQEAYVRRNNAPPPHDVLDNNHLQFRIANLRNARQNHAILEEPEENLRIVLNENQAARVVNIAPPPREFDI